MLWPSWEPERLRLADALRRHAAHVRPLPGIGEAHALETLALQFVASLRREAYYQRVQAKPVSARRADPNDPGFDAERAVARHVQRGDVDEAGWLVFLMTHFARPADTGWLRLQDVYGRLGEGTWHWPAVSADPAAFEAWLADNWQRVRGRFGNHRKYQSLRPNAAGGTGRVVRGYVDWVGSRGHRAMLADVVRRNGNDPHTIFDALYREMPLVGFGRLGRFDYLAMLGRYGIAPVEAGSAYLAGATGPASGASLLFDGARDGPTSRAGLQSMLDELDRDLRVGMAVTEDALCNWQKSPGRFVHYKG